MDLNGKNGSRNRLLIALAVCVTTIILAVIEAVTVIIVFD